MIVDVHCHLTDDYFKDKLDKVISNAEKKNVVSIITNGLNFKDNLNVLKLSKKYNLVKASFGLYPLEAVKLNEKELSSILEQIKKNKNNIVGIGEIGMDFKYNNEFEKQKEIFSNIIEISEKIKKPLIIHSRGAEKEVLELLETSKIKNFNLNQILTETDSPYLSPYKDKMNEPSFIIETIKKISEIKNLDKEEVEKIIFMNYQKFFLK